MSSPLLEDDAEEALEAEENKRISGEHCDAASVTIQPPTQTAVITDNSPFPINGPAVVQTSSTVAASYSAESLSSLAAVMSAEGRDYSSMIPGDAAAVSPRISAASVEATSSISTSDAASILDTTDGQKEGPIGPESIKLKRPSRKGEQETGAHMASSSSAESPKAERPDSSESYRSPLKTQAQESTSDSHDAGNLTGDTTNTNRLQSSSRRARARTPNPSANRYLTQRIERNSDNNSHDRPRAISSSVYEARTQNKARTVEDLYFEQRQRARSREWAKVNEEVFPIHNLLNQVFPTILGAPTAQNQLPPGTSHALNPATHSQTHQDLISSHASTTTN